MPMRHAQRKHIIHSLTSLLYQLHTVSFLLSPRLWPFICRLSTQFQFSRPREIDSQRSLRFWFILIFLVNLQCFYNHVFRGASEGRSIILDFVGIAHKPSKATLLSLDFTIVTLEFILTTIAYETSFIRAMPPDTPDPLQPEPIPAIPVSPLPLNGDDTDKSMVSTPSNSGPEYVVDIRLRALLQRLRHPPPPPPPQQPNLSDDLLPLPNTTTFQLTRSLNMLVRARAQMRERAARTPRPPGETEPQRPERQPGEAQESRRVPGSMGGEDEP
ncbi:hypothetical protein L227DRAFT_557527 [Lentinus tigrinus ALCF2SS1-6]|uniref:DUF1746 domain-containing protein n=1 Tax=Lentinus tigrinus ALCF2SS1-6 TaxID=1328759 RepID=A0A5C2RSR6_9APHY|nr:hypothetical protein L227DRAFT_557527 [Lentinus tigrinus ALCF2SS1-6]